MNQCNLQEAAQQGDVNAIATLTNLQLEPKAITAKIILKEGCLQVMLESPAVPDREGLLDFLLTYLMELEIKNITKFKFYGKQTDTFDFAWQQEVDLEAPLDQSQTIVEREKLLDSAYLYVDLEVNSQGNIYSIGWHNSQAENLATEDLEPAYKSLIEFKESGCSICGHNFRRFDYSYLIKEQPDLASWLVIDTLELSILAFPLARSHKLEKDYKQSEFAVNNPLEDARATKELLDRIIEALLEKPLALQQAYSWLLTCGTEESDRAYQQFFHILGLEVKESPKLADIPKEAIANLDPDYLQQFWSESATKDFDRRLCMAALIAGNYESNTTESERVFSGWLTHLPGFQETWEGAKLLPDYQSCLTRFGIENFRGKQEEAVKDILRGKRPLVIMPTGSGKSVCYQIPALMLFERQQALTVVISPLQALMADQVKDLENQGLNFCTFINGNLSVKERSQRLKQLRSSDTYGLLYISPEQLRSPSIRLLLQERLPSLWVIDEAHCMSQWGHDFRPDYRYIPKFIQELYQKQPLPLIALMTATARTTVQEDISQLFAEYNLALGSLISESKTRENLDYRVIPVTGNKDRLLIQEVQNFLRQGGCVLVYTTTRNKAENLAKLLNDQNIDARYYHGQLGKTEKEEVLQAFKTGELNIVVATCAFGMGINRPDVRAVIHHTISANLEGYIQETGRAGRDGKPASCTLLFDENDAEIIFSMQSQNQLNETDLKNIFISLRNIRDRIYGNPSDDWFLVTVNEIVQTSDLDEKFANNDQYREIKIKVALQYLEKFGLVERSENLSAYVQFELVEKTEEASHRKFEEYSQGKNLPKPQIKLFKNLISAMHLAKDYCYQQDQPVLFERLSDDSGIDPQELPRRIRELKKAEVCSAKIPLSFLLTKEVKGDALINYNRLCQQEDQLLDALLEIQGERESIQVNLRSLASRIDPDRSKKIRATNLRDILEGWHTQKWVSLTKLNRDLLYLNKIDVVVDRLDDHRTLASTVIEVLYQKLFGKKGARLRVEYELEELLNDVNQQTFLRRTDEAELSAVLRWLHQRKIIRMADGANLFHQALKIRMIKGGKETSISSGYRQIKAYYDQQNRRTQIMLKYGQTQTPTARQKLVDDYFCLSEKKFNQTYPDLSGEVAKLPVTEGDYNRIMGDLNSSQKEIVLAEDPAILVIAGPGSGKTWTIVRRIAYLVKVKRVDPDRILVLAYNRNAVRELRSRLQDIVGAIATGLRVYTFHGLALALLGYTLGENQGQKRLTRDEDFQQLIKEACDLMEFGDESEESDLADIKARRIQLLGNVEYIFVDEYQDVAEEEYRLIQLIAGLGDSEDESRSVQINLCVIGDDDQNLYEFRNTSVKYIQQFADEYQAKRFLLTENYRSTEPIIAAANHLISYNSNRCKQNPEEQVRINSQRQGQGGLPVSNFIFQDSLSQAVWVTEQIFSWIQEGIPANDIAVLAREWDSLDPMRLLLERKGIATYALKGGGEIKLVRNRVTCQLIEELNKNERTPILSPQESVQDWFKACFTDWNRSLEEPTVKTLLKIASDLDLERGYSSENEASNEALPISFGEIVMALLEFNKSDVFLDENAVLFTTCHGAKGLQFRKVILLCDRFKTFAKEIYSERRVFYVAMTRAKEQLILCSTNSNQFIQETDVSSQTINLELENLPTANLPQQIIYIDMTPRDVNLSYGVNPKQQEIVKNLREGDRVQMQVNRYGNSWAIFTQHGEEIGNLSRGATETLKKQEIQPNQFEFQPGDVTVKSIYRHFKIDDITGEIQEDWFVVIPKIRICR